MACAASAIFAGAALDPGIAFGQEAEPEDMEVLTRGPVHEAFAESVSFDPEPGIIIATQPPEAVEELPPEQQLEGDNVAWIPGYWAWDEEQNDFIWISGIWRNLPPDRQWEPGYWSDLDGGRFQWTSGYWSDTATTEVSYVSTAPPRNIDAGPNIEASSDDQSWIPGNWYWADTRYVWRPGYWTPLREDWTWVPSRYCWTPRGYVYVDGYWDHAVVRRGVVFAPVRFHHQVYSRPDYSYTPAIVVALNVFSDHLFVRPRYNHYYFGDYYAPRYRESGFFASFSWHSGRRGYDPIYAHDRWRHRGDSRWERRRHDDFDYFRDHENARPPRTWAAMRDYRDDRFNDGRNRRFASSLANYSGQSDGNRRFRKLEESRRKEIVTQRQEMKSFSKQRRERESRKDVDEKTSDRKSGVREKLDRSPIRGREADKFAKNDAPPKRPEARRDKDPVSDPDKNGKRKDGEARDKNDKRGKEADRDRAERDQRDDRKDGTPAKNREPNGKKTDKTSPERQDKDRAKKPEVPRREKAEAPKKERETDERAEPRRDEKREVAPSSRKPVALEKAEKPKARPTPKPQGREEEIRKEVKPKLQSSKPRQVNQEPAKSQRQKQEVRKAPEKQIRPEVSKPKQTSAPKKQNRPQEKARVSDQRGASSSATKEKKSGEKAEDEKKQR